ncbi:hypothetical protein I7I51_02329 [Histoplasma capsulatum]|uniref:Uncharacterized protein n=1 Tax=Ajellomyces capsulatus TaxID=5037 RepID=A0A8A1M9E8_AJECA|nr:hypothetical protein I7I51_02329 [Histoplasma capsulatum]
MPRVPAWAAPRASTNVSGHDCGAVLTELSLPDTFLQGTHLTNTIREHCVGLGSRTQFPMTKNESTVPIPWIGFDIGGGAVDGALDYRFYAATRAVKLQESMKAGVAKGFLLRRCSILRKFRSQL